MNGWIRHLRSVFWIDWMRLAFQFLQRQAALSCKINRRAKEWLSSWNEEGWPPPTWAPKGGPHDGPRCPASRATVRATLWYNREVHRLVDAGHRGPQWGPPFGAQANVRVKVWSRIYGRWQKQIIRESPRCPASRAAVRAALWRPSECENQSLVSNIWKMAKANHSREHARPWQQRIWNIWKTLKLWRPNMLLGPLHVLLCHVMYLFTSLESLGCSQTILLSSQQKQMFRNKERLAFIECQVC